MLACDLRSVKCFICIVKKGIYFPRLGRIICVADRDRKPVVLVLIVKRLILLHRSPDQLLTLPRTLAENHGAELIPAASCDDRRLRKRRPKIHRQILQCRIPDNMPIEIIDLLEIIEINKSKRHPTIRIVCCKFRQRLH